MEIKTHPIYDSYEFNTNGEYRKIGKTEWKKGAPQGEKYYVCSIKNEAGVKKTCNVHRAVWEAFKGAIPENYEIDHLDSNGLNNKLENLEAVEMSENRRRAQKNNHAFREIAKIGHTLKKNIKSLNLETNEIKYFKSKSQAGKHHGCSPALVYLICEGLNNAKNFQGYIKFMYCDEAEIENDKLIEIKDKRCGKSKYTKEEKKMMKKKYYQNKIKNI